MFEQLIYVTNTTKGWLIVSNVPPTIQFVRLRRQHESYTFL